jgi:hypothetical protein
MAFLKLFVFNSALNFKAESLSLIVEQAANKNKNKK